MLLSTRLLMPLAVAVLCLVHAAACQNFVLDGIGALWSSVGGGAGTAAPASEDTIPPRLASKALVRPAHRPTKPAEISAAEAALLADLQRKSLVSTCWKDAVASLRDGCLSLATIDEKRSRVALQFLHCQVQLDGKRSAATGALLSVSCPTGYNVKGCVQQLDDTMYPLYVQFRLHVDSLCFHAQEELFQERTEQAVFDLGRASDGATAKMRGIAQQTDDVRQRLTDLNAQHDEAVLLAQNIRTDLTAHAAAQAESLEQLSDRTVALVTGIHTAQAVAERIVEAHEAGLATIETKIGSVATQQAALFDVTRLAALSLQELLGASVSELEGHRRLIENISAHTHRMAVDAEAQQLKVEQANHDIFSVLGHIQHMQAALLGSVHAVSTGFYYFGLLLSVLLVTATPRTGGARAQCLLLAAAAGWTEVWIGVRPAVVYAARCLPPWLPQLLWPQLAGAPTDLDDELLRRVFRCALGCALLAAIIVAFVTYESPDEKIRRHIRNELHLLFAPRLAAVDALLQQHADATCDADVYAADGWSPGNASKASSTASSHAAFAATKLSEDAGLQLLPARRSPDAWALCGGMRSQTPVVKSRRAVPRK